MAYTNYRKLWIKHNGPIPKDEFGRSYEIHHLDNNKQNNNITNLKCVTILEHYKIHLKQGDYAAAFRIGQRMGVNAETKSLLMSLSNKKRIQEGNHPFKDPIVRAKALETIKKQIKDGTFCFLLKNKKPEWLQKAKKTYELHYDRKEVGKRGWKTWKNKKSKEEILKRISPASKAGAAKTKNTKWYHKLDGQQLRTIPTNPRIEKEKWILGRFEGSKRAIAASKKYSSKGKPRSEETKKKIKAAREKGSLQKYKEQDIMESIKKTNNKTQAVYYFNSNFGRISLPTLLKWEKIYINKNSGIYCKEY
jgi:hypothetical protein